MRRILLLLLLLPLAASGLPAGRTVPKAKLTAILSEAQRCEGAEMVQLGRVGTGAVKVLVRAAARRDPDARQALGLLRGVKRLSVLEYGDCAPEVREHLNRRLADALDGSELLMEAKDGSSAMRLFGIVDEASGTVRDFVLHSPDGCSLVCIFGSIPLNALEKAFADD